MTTQSPDNNEDPKGIQLQDLRHEAWRVYTAASGAKVQIVEPQGIHEGPQGHFIIDKQGVHHLIPQGWVNLSWLPKPRPQELNAPEGEEEE